MARTIRWSPEALDDLDEIAAFIGRDSPMRARAVVARLFEAADSLAELSERGRHVPELGRTDMREVFVHNYRVLYRVEPNLVVVSAVIHGSRLLDPAIGSRGT